LLVVMASDVVDGWLARRWDTASSRGAVLDVAADSLVTLGATGALVIAGVFPTWSFALVLGMLAQFVVTSGRGALHYDPFGRTYGAAVFGVIAITLVLPDAAMIATALVALVSSTIVALTGRLFLLRTDRG
jgi:phosphatidylglycerophosphate synthase